MATNYGDLFLSNISNKPLLSPYRERRLLRQYHTGDKVARKKALDKLVERNVRLVLSVVQQYQSRCQHLERDDLFIFGVVGLMIAIERFSIETHNRLSTYALWWIRQTIRRGVAQYDRQIRLPVHAQDDSYMIKKIAAQFEIQTGRAPTDQELLEQLEKCDMVSAKRAKRLLETVYYSPTVQNGVLTSLDSYDKDDNDAQDLYAIVQDKKAIDPVEHAIKEDQKYLLDQMISTLSRREQLIIRSLYGLDGGPPKTLQVVGDEIGLTRERIRQIRNKVIQKLQRRCTRDHRLKTFKNLF